MVAEVTFLSDNGEEIAIVNCEVADNPTDRYIGLSSVSELNYGEGMIFMYNSEDERTFVMRNMNFPIDIIMVDSEGEVTDIFEAPLPDIEQSDITLEEYTGIAQAVVEVPMGYCSDNNIDIGCRIDVLFL